jgi:hypothetical protein
MHAFILFLILILLVWCRIAYSIKESFSKQEETYIRSVLSYLFNTFNPFFEKGADGKPLITKNADGTSQFKFNQPIGSTGERGEQGPQGPQGLIGATGGIGPQGPQGLIGATGGIGPQGLIGATGGIGPQGPIGATGGIGPQGPIGATGGIGPQGPQGPTGDTLKNENNVPEPADAYTTLFTN